MISYLDHKCLNINASEWSRIPLTNVTCLCVNHILQVSNEDKIKVFYKIYIVVLMLMEDEDIKVGCVSQWIFKYNSLLQFSLCRLTAT